MKRIIPDDVRAAIIAELREREKYSVKQARRMRARYNIKAISRRYNVSRQTLTRLRARLIRADALSH